MVDHNRESRDLLVRGLKRKFPHAELLECEESASALETVANVTIDAVVLHRTFEHDAVSLVKAVRQVVPVVPIIVVSGIDRSEAVIAAGADVFLNYDEWLLLGNVVLNVLDAAAAKRAARHPDVRRKTLMIDARSEGNN